MSGYTDHDIDHGSMSNLNKWIEAPDSWISGYLYGNKGTGSPAMWRGIFVEQAVADTITENLKIDDAIEKALKDFDAKYDFDDGSVAKERKNIEPMARLAVGALEPYGKPDFPEDGGQHKVSMMARGDDWELNIIGFLDFKFPNHGLIIDLKTTGRMPPVMSKGHQRQRAFYAKASGNAAVKFLYVTPKKVALLEDGDTDEIMAEIKLHLTRQEAFLRLGDKELLRSIVPVNPDSFYWRGDEDVRKELYGL